MQRTSQKLIKLCKDYRKNGLSHRDIATMLKIGLGTAFKYTSDITITQEQHLALKRRNVPKPTLEQCRLGGSKNPNKFKPKYTRYDLIQSIEVFYKRRGRIPTKREVSSHKPFVRLFGTWNRAIKAAGFTPNPVRFATKHIAHDGHKCDSFAEFIVDNWLSHNNISHQIHVPYPDSKMTADFVVNSIHLEFVGLEGEIAKYDELISRKRTMAMQHNLQLVEIFPKDLFPENKLDAILKPLLLAQEV